MDHNDVIRDFRDLTGATDSQAREYLEGHQWNLESAAQDYFASLDEVHAESGAASSASQPEPEPEPEYAGPRTLDGRPAPQYDPSSATSSKAKGAQQKKKGVATLGSLSSAGAHNDDDDDDMESDKDDRGPLFAGGEKSGLAVQDPRNQGNSGKKIVKDLLAQAKSNKTRPEAEAGPSASSRPNAAFRGTGMTLGGDGVESRAIPDPLGPPPPRQRPEREAQSQEFVLHLWEDGFSIDDGELKRYDDPANQLALNMIKAGRAPIHLMNVNYDALVDVKLEQHDEKWRQLPKKYKPFGGEGRRLGSPVPGDGNAAAKSSAQDAAAAPPPTSAPMSTTEFQVDTSQPTLQLRIQMPDGSRLPARFNTTHTIGDVYQFVSRSSADVSTRPWVLATTFPNKDHTDKSLVLGEMPEFKRGGAAVVKWA